jgi:hypothetical protein
MQRMAKPKLVVSFALVTRIESQPFPMATRLDLDHKIKYKTSKAARFCHKIANFDLDDVTFSKRVGCFLAKCQRTTSHEFAIAAATWAVFNNLSGVIRNTTPRAYRWGLLMEVARVK